MPGPDQGIDAQQVASTAARILERCEQLGRCSEDPSRLTRTFCCPAMSQVHQQLTEWMTLAGMECRVDALGNLIGRANGSTAASPVFMIGSHLDTVIDAGKYDGPLGVLLGLGVAELLCESGIELPFALEVIGFCEEEGVRFNTPFLGSRAVAGSFSADLLDLTDANGISVKSALDAFGVDASKWRTAEYPVQTLLGFLEPHIEQGPVLEQAGLPVAVVSAIAGQTRATFVFSGQAGHAGTIPHEFRKDALAAAAEFIGGVERIGQNTDGLFATIADISVWPNVSNVVAGRTQARLDLRHVDDAQRLTAFDQIQQLAADISERRGLAWEIEACQQQPAVPMDKSLSRRLSESIKAAAIQVHEMPSGAGHDAVMMARRTPTSMLFLRCRGGVSHHPDESVDVKDIAVGLDILVRMVTSLQPANKGST
jgi:allantoate deiminase